MTWLLSNGESTRAFDTREAAEEAKADLDGLGPDLTIEEDTDDSDDIDAGYVNMPGDEEQSAGAGADDATDNNGCPSCGEVSTTIYRCSECGRDLAGIRGVGTGGER